MAGVVSAKRYRSGVKGLNMADTRVWGTLTKKQVEVLREFLNRFIAVCPDADTR